MEHLAKAQVSYLRTVSELREKVTKLEAYPFSISFSAISLHWARRSRIS